MLTTVATFALGAALMAFAVAAALLNESEHAARRRLKRGGQAAPNEGTPDGEPDLTWASRTKRDGRRMPVGDFLFGALFLRGEHPLPFAELAGSAADSGMHIDQVLTWLARAEESGLVERVDEAGEGSEAAQPAVRLTAAGMEVARSNRRAAGRSVRSPS